MNKRQSGFTLVELLVIAPILMVTIVYMMSFLFSQYGQLTQQGSQLDLQAEAQNITFSLQDDIFFTSSFVSTMNSNLEDSYKPSGGWQSNTTPPTLILSLPALTKNRRDANRRPVYINTQGCTPQATLEENDVLYNNIIVFVSGSNLYKRTISAPATTSTCETSFEKQSCPSANATSACPADKLLTDKLNTFSVTYYTADNTETASPESADKVKIDLQLKDRAFAEDIYTTSSVTLRKLNQ
jgi:hypothetical protein